MKIVQVSTVDIKGGAAKAAYRLHKGLIEIGQDSLFLTSRKHSSDQTVIPLSSFKGAEDLDIYLATIQKYYIKKNRTQISNTLFSLPYPGLDLSQLDHVLSSDVINLHWIAHFQSPASIKKLLALNKPVVWTLHDMSAFTGGCHYSSGCLEYEDICYHCPQLKRDSFGLTSAILQDKLELINSPNLVIVTPSQWLAECSRKSKLFKHCRIETIPYGLETNVFFPTPKAQAKKLLNINSDTIALLVGADEGNEHRKGFTELYNALQLCHEELQPLIKSNKIILLSFGNPNYQLQQLDIPILNFGQIQDDTLLAQIYSAADMFLLPSLEDNLPNTMLEAMSSGTAVLAFQVGGIPDLIEEGITGKIIAGMDIHQMSRAILELVFQSNLSQQMGINGRSKIERSYSLARQAEKYLDLYQDILKNCVSLRESYVYPEVLTVPLDYTFGSNFKQIFYQVALEASREKAEELEGVLSLTQTQLTQRQQAYSEIEQVQNELQQSKEVIETQVCHLQVELEQTQIELKDAKETVYAMTTSKFWKIRKLWFKFKRFFLGKDVK